MNATKIPIKNNPSTRRIRIFSQILKALVLIYMVVIPLISIASPAIVHFAVVKFVLLPGQTIGSAHSTTDYPSPSAGMKLVTALTATIYLLGAVVFYRLLNLYEKGIVFSSANVRLFRLLGCLAFFKGLLAAAALAASFGDDRVFTMFLFAALRSPWVIGGLFGILLSYIMDEGCKLQEEQELTV
jgi:hypothetical protein